MTDTHHMLDLDPARFTERAAPGTGRRALRLTSGDATCYPLYYFIPTITSDGRTLIYHRCADDQMVLHTLDLRTGDDQALYAGRVPDCGWRPWDVSPGRGAWDHRSVLDQVGHQLIVFDQHEVIAIDLATREPRPLFQLPDGREPIGQNGVTPDGQWLVYIHCDATQYAALFTEPGWNHYWPSRATITGATLAAYHLRTGEQRVLVTINSPIHHVLPLDNDRVVFCHPATESGMLLTDLRGGWYTHLRTQDEQHGTVCHYLGTKRGLMYEILHRTDGRVLSGLYHPDSHQRIEFPLPTAFGYTHTGRDPEGRLWFWENSAQDSHDLWALIEHRGDDDADWLRLCHDWPTFGTGQRSHFHPQLTPDRQWILFVAGDEPSGRNHIHLLDVSDLDDTRGIPDLG